MFTHRTLAFLRQLKRHNNRPWFEANRDRYERDVKTPMLELIERLAADLPAFAPDLVASPKTSPYRIYRDTRFSKDKSPYKTHVAAIFPHRQLSKHGGAGMYLHVGTTEVFIGGGIYQPSTQDLHWIRNRLVRQYPRFRRIVNGPSFRRAFGDLWGDSLQRVPRGFPADHPAADDLKRRQFLAGCERDPESATSRRFYADVVSRFRVLAPFIDFLNGAILEGRESVNDPLVSDRAS